MSQNIIIHRTTDPFARIPKAVLDDDRLSWKAKGVLCYLLSKPSGWRLRVSDLENKAKEGNWAVKSALKELQTAGYADLRKILDTKHRIVEWRWKISDMPEFTPEVGFPPVDSPPLGNSPLSKTDCTKTECTEIEDLKETKETPPSDGGSFEAEWKPTGKGKEEQLRRVRPPKDYPSEDEFLAFVTAEGLERSESYRPDLYEYLCRLKWHRWVARRKRWERIFDWRKYVSSFEVKLEQDFPA